jgi:hypothetical protein
MGAPRGRYLKGRCSGHWLTRQLDADLISASQIAGPRRPFRSSNSEGESSHLFRRLQLAFDWFKRFGEERFEQVAPAMVAVRNKFYGVFSGTEQLWDDLSPALTRSFSSPM